MMLYVLNMQKDLFVEYARAKIQEIGDRIHSHNSKNHMDRTGNLLDSLCWGVSYNGKLYGHGFYRPKQATEPSYLHEWSKASFRDKYDKSSWVDDADASEPVNGRELAKEYLDSYGNRGGKGWRVFFAILAPYWGYWEKGFILKTGGGRSSIPRNERFVQFAVMTEFHDEIKRDLKPMYVRKPRVSVAKYTVFRTLRIAKKNFYG